MGWFVGLPIAEMGPDVILKEGTEPRNSARRIR